MSDQAGILSVNYYSCYSKMWHIATEQDTDGENTKCTLGMPPHPLQVVPVVSLLLTYKSASPQLFHCTFEPLFRMGR